MKPNAKLNMKTLALEFSSPQRSVALLDNESRATLGITSEQGGKSMRPLAMIEAVLQGAGAGRTAVDRIVVGLGPGSSAGIRAAIAIAQGSLLGRAVQFFGISSVEAVARQGWQAVRRG